VARFLNMVVSLLEKGVDLPYWFTERRLFRRNCAAWIFSSFSRQCIVCSPSCQNRTAQSWKENLPTPNS